MSAASSGSTDWRPRSSGATPSCAGQRAVPRRRRRWPGPSGRGLRAAGVGKTRLGLGVREVRGRLADTVLLHSGRCLSYGDGSGVLGAGRDGAPAVRDRRGGRLAGGHGQNCMQARRWIVERRRACVRHAAPRCPGRRDGGGLAARGAVRRVAAVPRAAGRQRARGHGRRRRPVGRDGLLDFSDHLLDWSTEFPIFMLGLARPELAERRVAGPGTGAPQP